MQGGAKGYRKGNRKGNTDQKTQWEQNNGQNYSAHKGSQGSKGYGSKGFGKKGSYGKRKGGAPGKGWSTYGVWDDESWDDSALFLCDIPSGDPFTSNDSDVDAETPQDLSNPSISESECARSGLAQGSGGARLARLCHQ